VVNSAGSANSNADCGNATRHGWTQQSFDYRISHPYDVADSDRSSEYRRLYKTWVRSDDKPHDPSSITNPRTEMVWSKRYLSGMNMWEAEIFVPSTTSGSNIFQIFKPDHGESVEPTDVRIRISDAYGGWLRALQIDNAATEIARGMYNKWFKMQVVHNRHTRKINVYIDNIRVVTLLDTSPWPVPERPGQFHTFKNGVYGCDPIKDDQGRVVEHRQCEAQFRRFRFGYKPV
jgi:hypothetical protein